MKTPFYVLCALGALLVTAIATPADAANTHKPALAHNAATSCSAMSEAATPPLGRRKKKRASSTPTRLNRQMHQNQTQLKAKARRESNSNWKRCKNGF
ncbi:hypothetical protein [Hymenobacter sp. IS2118]|uniref:hypothetical protein n=1 Tax=Hymenobacter sp. IS2118 TaxID=1505605 RepID=UPI0012680C69|nr:hypothetical protein [Hymenobacter sp. IS2118]